MSNPYENYLQLTTPTMGQKLLDIEAVNSLPERSIILGLYPMDPKEQLFMIKRVRHHDRLSTYAVPHHIYIEQRPKWSYEISGVGQYQLGRGLHDIRLWLLPEPIEPLVEDGDEVWATMLN